MPRDSSSTDFQSAEFLSGFRDIAPLSFGVAVYGAAFGLLAAQIGMDGLTTGVMSLLVFAGSSQIIAAERMASDASIAMAIAAGLALNLRIMLMTAEMRGELKDRPWWQILIGIHLTSDENWALMHATRSTGRAAGYWYLIGGGTSLIGVWVLVTALVAVFSGLLPDSSSASLGFAFTAAFILLLRNLWRDWRDLQPWIVSAITAAALASLLPLDPSWALIAGALTGASCVGLMQK